MTGTSNDGNIDIAALQTDGNKIIDFGPFELFSYEDMEIKELIFKTFKEDNASPSPVPPPKQSLKPVLKDNLKGRVEHWLGW